MNLRLVLVCSLILGHFSSGCSIDTAKRHYVLAENLWNEGQYSAAVAEFEKVVARDPKGTLGRQALFRAAMTEELFLSRYPEAIKKFQAFSEGGEDPSTSREAEKRIGEILFAKLENHDQAIQHYEKMLKESPQASEGSIFLFRIAKSHFFLLRFENSIKAYRKLMESFPTSVWAEKAAFEIGVSLYTWGSQQKGRGDSSYIELLEDAITAYRRFIRIYPKSQLLSQAKFGMGECYEELDQLDKAYQYYEVVRDSYPSKNVVQIKLVRIKERKAQRSR